MLSAGLVAALQSQGLNVGYCKPISTDGQKIDGRLVSPDALRVAELCGLTDPWDMLNPVCLSAPLAPLAAARREHAPVDLALAKRGIEECLAAHDFSVIEGVGGLMVPLTDDHTLLDLAADLGLPVLVVGRPNLGTINHTLLTIGALQAREVRVAAFCFSVPPPAAADDPALADNPALIMEFSGVPHAGTLPWQGQQPAVESLTRSVLEHLDLGIITSG